MKKYLSVYMVYVRSSIYKVLLLLVAMASVQTLLYFNVAREIAGDSVLSEKYIGIEHFIENSNMGVAFAVALVLISVILCYAGCEFSGRQGYTLRRLRISENKVFLVQVGVNAMFYIMLWLWQIMVVCFLMLLYKRDVPAEIYTNQTFMLSFYRSGFLSGLMPMGNLVCLVRNIIWILALAVTSAFFPYLQRRRKIGFSVIVMLVIVIAGFVPGDNIGLQALPAVWAVLIVFAVIWIVVRGECDEKEA